MSEFNIRAYHEGDALAEIAFRRQLILALVPKYMTTGTATTDVSINADAAADAKRMQAAFLAVLGIDIYVP